MDNQLVRTDLTFGSRLQRAALTLGLPLFLLAAIPAMIVIVPQFDELSHALGIVGGILAGLGVAYLSQRKRGDDISGNWLATASSVIGTSTIAITEVNAVYTVVPFISAAIFEIIINRLRTRRKELEEAARNSRQNSI